MMNPKLVTPATPNCWLRPRQAIASTAVYTRRMIRYSNAFPYVLGPGTEQTGRPNGEHGEQYHEGHHVLVVGLDVGGAHFRRQADYQGAEHGPVRVARSAEEHG